MVGNFVEINWLSVIIYFVFNLGYSFEPEAASYVENGIWTMMHGTKVTAVKKTITKELTMNHSLIKEYEFSSPLTLVKLGSMCREDGRDNMNNDTEKLKTLSTQCYECILIWQEISICLMKCQKLITYFKCLLWIRLLWSFTS